MPRGENTARHLLQALFVLVFLGPPILREGLPGGALQASPTALTTSQQLHILAWLLAGIVGLLVLGSGERWHAALRLSGGGPLRWYMLFVAMAGLSILYSVSQVYTAFLAWKLVASVFVVMALAALSTEQPAKSLLKSLYVASYLGLVLEVALLLLRPELVGVELPGIGFRLYGGIFGDYGAFASIAGLGLLVAALYGERPATRLSGWLAYAFTWYLLILTRTRSSIIGALAILAIMTLLHARLHVRFIAGYVALFGLFLVSASEAVRQPVADLVLRGQALPVVFEFSGRTDAFTYGLQAWHQSPWLGYGFGGGNISVFAQYADITGQGIGAAHDALSKVLLDLGLLGGSVLAVCVVLALTGLVRLLVAKRARRRYRLEVLQSFALVAWVLARSVVGGGVADVSLPFVVALVVVRIVEVTRASSSWMYVGEGRVEADAPDGRESLVPISRA
jgi:hypothetical protein